MRERARERSFKWVYKRHYRTTPRGGMAPFNVGIGAVPFLASDLLVHFQMTQRKQPDNLLSRKIPNAIPVAKQNQKSQTTKKLRMLHSQFAKKVSSV